MVRNRVCEKTLLLVNYFQYFNEKKCKYNRLDEKKREKNNENVFTTSSPDMIKKKKGKSEK